MNNIIQNRTIFLEGGNSKQNSIENILYNISCKLLFKSDENILHIENMVNYNGTEEIINTYKKIKENFNDNLSFDDKHNLIEGVEEYYKPEFINPIFLEKQKKEGGIIDIELIIKAQMIRSSLYAYIEYYVKSNDVYVGEEYDRLVFIAFGIEKILHKAWGFNNKESWNYFGFWNIPGIGQPVLDNSEALGTGFFTIVENEAMSGHIYRNLIRNFDLMSEKGLFSEIINKIKDF